jgi:hypothetical protein
MLLSKARERDIVGNSVPENMAAAEKRLELLNDRGKKAVGERKP